MKKYCHDCKHKHVNHWTKKTCLMCTHPNLPRALWAASPMELAEHIRKDEQFCGLEGKWHEKG